ncbi:MAG: leucine-rich repeat domain-containing protein [Bacilli bacterium]|nr:leucine-rich repeat domain-containing protein [Bacilli bacterium]
MEKKEKILLTSTCGLGMVSIVFISLFAWKAATSGGGDVPPEPVDHVKVNFATEGCKVYKDDKAITSDEAIKDAYQIYTIKLDDEYKQDYDLSEYSLKVYTLNGEEYDSTRYTFNYKAGTLLINPSEEVNVKCRATLAVTKFTYVYSDDDYEVTLQIQGVFDYIDWGDGARSMYTLPGTYSHEYNEETIEGTEYVIRIVGSASKIITMQPGGFGPRWLKEVYFSHYITDIPDSLMRQGYEYQCPVENVYIEDGIEVVSSLSAKTLNYSNVIKSVRLPETAKLLSGTFRDAQSLNEISIPDGVTMFSTGLFASSQIKKVNFTSKSKLTYISDQSFTTNSAIEELTLPKHVSHINAQAFSNCSSLTTLDLSLLDSVPYLGDTIATEEIDMMDTVFYGCDSLSKIIVPKGMKEAYLNDESWQVQKLSSAGTAGEVLDLIVEAE